MPTPKNITNSPLAPEFHTPEDFRERTFFDAFADAFTWPEDLPLHQPDSIPMGRIRDAQHIREYFRKAVAVEEDRNSHTTTD